MSTREERMRRIDAAVFRTITGEDWRRSLVRARTERNQVRVQIEKILASKLGKTTPERGGKNE